MALRDSGTGEADGGWGRAREEGEDGEEGEEGEGGGIDFFITSK